MVDVNECEDGTHNCPEKSTCENAVGSHTCLCMGGYKMMNGECVGRYKTHTDMHIMHVMCLCKLNIILN